MTVRTSSRKARANKKKVSRLNAAAANANASGEESYDGDETEEEVIAPKKKSATKSASGASTKAAVAVAVTTEEEKTTKKSNNKKKEVSAPELKLRAKNMKKDVEHEMSDVDSKLETFGDNTWIHTYEIMFKRLRKIMRTVEAKVMASNSSQDIYALMALYNQMREVIADIRSMIDLTQNTQRIIDNVLYPMVRDISNNYVDAIFMIKKTLRSNVESEKYIDLKAEIDNCLKEHAKYIQSSYEKSSELLTKLLEE
jgi:hypothetical protein